MKILFTIFSIFLFLSNTALADRLYSPGAELNSLTADMEFTLASGAGATIDATTKRSGSYSTKTTSVASTRQGFVKRYLLSSAAGPFFFRSYIYVDTCPSGITTLLVATSGYTISSTIVGSVRMQSDCTLEVWENSVSKVGNSSAALSTATWYMVEFEFVAGAGGTGILKGRLNGVEFATGTATLGDIIAFRWGSNMAAESQAVGVFYYDDMAVNDTAGTNQTTYAGDGRIVFARPNAAGDNAMGVRGGADSGSDHGQMNEVPPDDSTGYYNLDVGNDIVDINVTASSDLGIDSYDTITFIQVGARICTPATQSRSWAPRLKSAAGGTTSQGATTAITGTVCVTNDDTVPMSYILTSYTDPTTTVAWTPTGTNSLDNAQIGAIVIDADPDVYISNLWGLVEFVDGAAPGGGGAAPSVNKQDIFNFD